MTPVDFVRAHTRLAAPPLVSEIALYLADDVIALWEKMETELDHTGLPPPFWAAAWAGGQALARYVLDVPESVAGRTVLDLASGCGIAAIAAAVAGAARVTAVEVDEHAVAAIGLNTAANGIAVDCVLRDVLDDEPADAGIVLAGDVCYDRSMTGRVLPFLLRSRARGSDVLIGDPGRAYLPKDRLTALATYDVPVPEMEGVDIRRTTVWRLRP
ncbi:class I SAM-dependent methyltransferase [Pseudonocardia asaccharolytica]|uniref:Nicotinamide N-methylase n=1 Tax=Pseudonocardia asaccharolytica DSM 44247 = NBRC 16224 TaxID=1123024 RepID=A0A511D2K1_9PSEU|nr:50S ribosomal protein L11 methyltransferase [Pseudonocardia asaccharolytica]GEL19019.1 nicotinamide N-methylase [Pseudonocardia asaccharolytica DSM 44247 = NBRC 16224]